MKNEIMTFSPVDNELLLSEMDMMEVYGGTGAGGGSKTYCGHAKCGCSPKYGICTGNNDVKAPSCPTIGGGSGSGNGSGSGSGSGNGSGSGSGKGK